MKKEKTYAEAEGAQSFDWKKFLNKDFTKRSTKLSIELSNASDRAASWVTCACGNQCAIIQRDSLTGAPRNKELRVLGELFSRNINELDDEYKSNGSYIVEIQEKCQDTLEKIEAKSTALINFMRNPNKKMIAKRKK